MRWKRAKGEDHYSDSASCETLILRMAREKGALRTQHMHRLQTSEKQISDIGYEPAPKAEIDRLEQDADT